MREGQGRKQKRNPWVREMRGLKRKSKGRRRKKRKLRREWKREKYIKGNFVNLAGNDVSNGAILKSKNLRQKPILGFGIEPFIQFSS